ncbi:hypothetical protein YTPLAS72_26280 [Nitrospira sp.]|nr:hypothetical protein YTPLAS72_26280 [Nitrospira sp.]
MTDEVVVATIAGVVALLVSLVSAWLTHLSTERKLRLEIIERRRDKLLDLRLEAYPQAFALTGQLRFAKGKESSRMELKNIAEELRAWWVGSAAAMLSGESVKSYYRLSRALQSAAIETTPVESTSLAAVFEANRLFRVALRADLGLEQTLEGEDSDA